MSEAVDPFFTDDFESVMVWPAVSRTYAGLEGLRKNWLDWLEPWATYRSTFDELIDLGERVVVLLRDHGRRKDMETEGRADRGHDLDVQRGKDRKVGGLRRSDGSSRSRGAVGAERSRRLLLTLRDTARTMSQQNVEIVLRCAGAMNGRDLSQLSQIYDLCDPDIELDLSRNIFNPDVYRGYSGLERFRSVVEDVWADFQGELEEIVVAGDDKVVTAITMQGKGRESGVEVRMQVFQIWTLRDSKVVRVVGGYRDRSEAIEAAGLSE